MIDWLKRLAGKDVPLAPGHINLPRPDTRPDMISSPMIGMFLDKLHAQDPVEYEEAVAAMLSGHAAALEFDGKTVRIIKASDWTRPTKESDMPVTNKDGVPGYQFPDAHTFPETEFKDAGPDERAKPTYPPETEHPHDGTVSMPDPTPAEDLDDGATHDTLTDVHLDSLSKHLGVARLPPDGKVPPGHLYLMPNGETFVNHSDATVLFAQDGTRLGTEDLGARTRDDDEGETDPDDDADFGEAIRRLDRLTTEMIISPDEKRRFVVLKLAHEHLGDGTPEAVIKRAKAYEEYLRGVDAGEAEA